MTAPTPRELHSERIVAGSRTYFFDFKETTDGTKYLVISESRQNGEDWEHHQVMIFEENFGPFFEALSRVAQTLGVSRGPYAVGTIRQKHARAYEPWTTEDDERLAARYSEGVSVTELARMFQRQESAIRSRLQKLGLTPHSGER